MPQDPKNPAWYTWPLPHLRPDAPFVNLPLIDENNKLFYWFKTEPQKFINLQVVSLIRDLYFSKKKQLIEDAHLPCLEFFVQKINYFDPSNSYTILNLLWKICGFQWQKLIIFIKIPIL